MGVASVVAPNTVSLYERRAGAKKSTLVATVPVMMTSNGGWDRSRRGPPAA
jgi:hypothetical protein